MDTKRNSMPMGPAERGEKALRIAIEPFFGGRKMPNNDNSSSVSATLLDVHSVAEQLNCSPRHVRRLADSGKMPRPVKLGALVRWNQQVIEDWIKEGCPRQSGGERNR